MHEEKDHIREELIRELKKNRVFWSYKKPERDPDVEKVLIEKILIHLDLEDISKLFLIFPKEEVKQVWIDKLVTDHRYHSLNVLYAYLYFNIKNPEQYLENMLHQHHKKLGAS